tara:strand:+ start:17849 stop:18379 length:531 start_codon:yes stop_codon:yes gene_type:complete
MSLRNRIKPGDALDASLTLQNFQDIQTLANNVQPKQIVDGSLDTRHLTGTWKTLGKEVAAGPLAPAAGNQVVVGAGGNYTTYNSQPILIVASCQVEFTATPADLSLDLWVDGASVYSLNWKGGRGAATGSQKFVATLPHILLGDATNTRTIQLMETGAGAGWSITNSELEVLVVSR